MLFSDGDSAKRDHQFLRGRDLMKAGRIAVNFFAPLPTAITKKARFITHELSPLPTIEVCSFSSGGFLRTPSAILSGEGLSEGTKRIAAKIYLIIPQYAMAKPSNSYSKVLLLRTASLSDSQTLP